MGDSIVWVLWIVLGVILIIAEVVTPGFVLLWFGVGALAAALASFLGAGLAAQFLVFIALSSILTALSRTLFVNYFTQRDEPDGLKVGASSLPGKVGTVVTSSRGALNEGAVKVFGSVWTAYPAEGEPPLEAGDRVVVERLQGASIYVRRADSLPDWRAQELTDGGEGKTR
jgi:membrane protein implicated in regulation of membrane protease activity